MANLQYTIDKARVDDSCAEFLNFELLPDFISKRIATLFKIERSAGERIVPWLTVSTFYAHAYATVGWPGMLIMFIFFVTTTFAYLILLRKSSAYYVTGFAVMNALVLFNTFDNMYAFTGMSLQLIYPLLLSFVRFPKVKLGLRADTF